MAALVAWLALAESIHAGEPAMRGVALPSQTSAGGERFGDMLRRDDIERPGLGQNRSLPLPHLIPVDPRRSLALPARHGAQRLLQDSQATSVSTAQLLGGQTIGVSFKTIGQVNQDASFDFSWFPPNASAAMGPSHLVEAVEQSLAVYSRAGVLLSHVTLASFLNLTQNSVVYPRNGAGSPRVIYDLRSARWFVAAIEGGNPVGSANHVILAVSRGPDPLTSLWDKYLILAGQPAIGMTVYTTQSLTLGLDDNGVYLGMTILPTTVQTVGEPVYKIIAVAKASLLAPNPAISVSAAYYPLTDLWGSPQPAVNLDEGGGATPAWFLASSNQLYGNIHYRTLNWVGGIPFLSDASSILSTPTYGDVPGVAVQGGANIFSPSDFMQAAMIRNGRLWCCRTIGLNAGGGGSSDIDRTACEWFELSVAAPVPSLIQLGRVVDLAATNPISFFYPSISVSGQGHAALGFSGGGTAQFLSSFLMHRLADDSLGFMRPRLTLHAGEGGYTQPDGGNHTRWGRYSSTFLDPNDAMTLWTVQPYAANPPANFWGTWTASLRAPPPFVSFTPTTALQGQTDVPVTIQGADFYDPGPGFPNRLTASVSGLGISVASVHYVDPTRIELTVNISPTATLGNHTITITNPDGQVVAGTALLNVQSPVMCQTLFGDMNGDSVVDGVDVRGFVDCYLRGSPTLPGCGCADLQRDEQFTHADVVLLKIKLLGFGSPTTACITSCPGDMNADLRFDGRDIQAFLDCYRRGPFVTSGCVCADINEDNRVNDTDLFMLINMIMRVDNSTPNCQ